MSGSRRFLLVLVLASVTCVVLIQVTLDGWHFGRTFPYGDDYHKKDFKKDPLQQLITGNNTTKEIPKTSVIKIVKLPVTTHLMSKATIANVDKRFTTKSSIYTSQKLQSPVFQKVTKANQNVQARVQVRRLPLGNRPFRHDMKQLVNRQERLQEILKQSKIIRGSTIDPMKTLKSMAVANPSNVSRILVITYFRAGSSFFGDILQQNWKTFYNFEPLHSMTYNSRIGDDKVRKVFDLFNGVFKCNFTELNDYMKWVKQPRNQFLFAHNLFLWVTCHSNPKTCFNPGFVNAVCHRAPIHVMKVTRLHMRHLRQYLTENPDLKIQVVYLTRDPRAIISSRSTLDWCNGTECSDPEVLCREMSEDIAIFKDLQRKEPHHFINVRYEDLALNPENETERLFTFLKLPFSKSVKKFLKTHTVSRRADINNPYSTRRNSSAMVFMWREKVTYKQVLRIQVSCEEALHYLNHSMITSSSELPYPNGSLINSEKLTLNASVSRINSLPTKNKSISTFVGKKVETVKYNKDDNNRQHLKHLPYSSLNNTNIEVHKTYKLLHNFKTKDVNESKYYPVKNKKHLK